MSKIIAVILIAILCGALVRCHLMDKDGQQEHVESQITTTCMIHAEGKIIYQPCN